MAHPQLHEVFIKGRINNPTTEADLPRARIKPPIFRVPTSLRPYLSRQSKVLAATESHGAGLVSVAAVNGPDSLTLAGPRRLLELVAAAALSPSAPAAVPSLPSGVVAEANSRVSLESLEQGGGGGGCDGGKNLAREGGPSRRGSSIATTWNSSGISLASLVEDGNGNGKGNLRGEGGDTSVGETESVSTIAGSTRCSSLGTEAGAELPADRFRILQGVSRAFHSPAMSLAADGTREAARKVSLRDPAIPLASNVTGRLAGAGELTDPAYWSKVCD